MALCNDPNFRLKVFEQLQSGSPTGGSDCGPASTLQALHIASCGRFKYGDKANRTYLAAEVRRRGGMDPARLGTSNTDNWTAFKAFKPEFNALGLERPRADLWLGASFNSVLVPALAAGKSAFMSVDYWDISTWNNRSIMGQKIYSHRYRSGYGPSPYGDNFKHYITVGQYRLINGVPWVTEADPLCDGRLSGSCNCVIPKGPQDMPLSLLRAATGHAVNSPFGATPYAEGQFSGYIFDISPLIATPEPTPNTPASGLAAASSVGATNFKLVSVTDIVAGDYLDLGPPNYERLIIAPGGVGTPGSSGTGVTTTTGAVYPHSAGDPVASGTVPPPPDTTVLIDPEPFSPCDERTE